MNPMWQFEEYVKSGIVKTQAPDFSRANALKRDAEQTLQFLKSIIEKIGITEQNATTIIKMSYDLLMDMIRAKMLQKGFHARGEGAHEATVAYLRVLQYREQDVQFADQMRKARHWIMYYGKHYDAGYAEKAVQFLEKVYPQLK